MYVQNQNRKTTSSTHLNSILCNAVAQIMEQAKIAPAFERKQLLLEAATIDEIRFRLCKKTTNEPAQAKTAGNSIPEDFAA